MPPSSRILKLAAGVECYPAQRRNRHPTSTKTASNKTSKPYAQRSASPASTSSSLGASSVTSASPSSSSSVSDSNDEHCTCRMSGCGKAFNRVYDLLRHLASKTHRAAMTNADAAAILAAGVPVAYLPRAQQLLGRQNKCAVCDRVFSRRDALRRHLAEAGHRLKEEPQDDDVVLLPSPPSSSAASLSPPTAAPPPGYQWALVPAPQPAPEPVVAPVFDLDFAFALGMFDVSPPPVQPPVAPQLTDFDDFAFVDGDLFASPITVAEPAPAAMQPSLFDETMAMWFGPSSSGL